MSWLIWLLIYAHKGSLVLFIYFIGCELMEMSSLPVIKWENVLDTAVKLHDLYFFIFNIVIKSFNSHSVLQVLETFIVHEEQIFLNLSHIGLQSCPLLLLDVMLE